MSSEEYLAAVIRPLLQYPEEMRIERTTTEQGEVLCLEVHTEDRGVCIGKGGATANAVRQLLGIVGYKNGERIGLSVIPGKDFKFTGK